MPLITPVKSLVKRCLQLFAAKCGRHTQKHNKPRLVILMYHRVLPDNDNRVQFEEPGMRVSPETFAMHIEQVRKYFDIVSLSDWVEKRDKGLPLPYKACAITFDDGWADNYEYAYPVLRAQQVPATIFLVSDMIGTDRMFWPERIARVCFSIASFHPTQWSHPLLEWLRQANTDYSFSSAPPDTEELSQIVAHAKGLSDAEIHSRLDAIEAELGLDCSPGSPSLLSWDQVNEMIQSGLVEAESHTCNHIRLNDDVGSEALTHEISGSRAIIARHTGTDVAGFCYPNGDYSDEAHNLAKEHYHYAVTTQNGWNDSDSDPHLLQRIGVHDDISRDKIAFLARISGWL